MGMPGFTGETSLYQTMGRYRAAASAAAALAGGRSVLPQLPRSIGFCMADCDGQYEWGSLPNTMCKFDCMDAGFGGNGGGGGGGGGGGVDDARLCAQCKAACLKKPLSQRAACRQDCVENVC
jgi:hypothetical protein